ncbi:carboxylate--amine ligase [Pseudomonas edaphica]|uniref:Carboxylate--amine ligase n=1 Tax=Pseudomonas edaphica TaxID=2006980 RepID=A0ABY2U2D9_9PSED|nr:ATP-grasp domain-containing protein [Pseudomonas edaphica]TLG90307.1 carboxylate--amine ligase [Pseudomonas edaphica]
MIWFLEGQSSQRDVVMSTREALPVSVKVFASHRQDRPEITGQADVSFQEIHDSAERIGWVIETALEHRITVVIAGRAGSVYEASRKRFGVAGIGLVTGGLSMDTFSKVDDKSLFTAEAERAGLACIPAITVTNGRELVAAYKCLSDAGEVCIKPTVGVYGQGFWRFKSQADPFRCLENPGAREVDFNTYLKLYVSGPQRVPMLMMPYLSGNECSVDIVCEAGKPVAYVGRRKHGAYQSFERESSAVELALKACAHFKCDGLVNVQTRDNQAGIPHLLEINPRYSGGIGYTRAAGVNLAGIFATRRLGLPEPPSQWVEGVRVKPITVAVMAST